jgi:phosphatidylglycerophosphate synthase
MSATDAGLPRLGIGATCKPREVEETLDLWFYRPLGYLVARGARWMGLSPNAVTLLGMVFGVVAGHLLFYATRLAAAAAVLLLVVSETFDSADGQLARMTGQYSSVGRILDGLASNMVFASIYVHLVLRLAPEWGGVTMVALVLMAGASHSVQCAVADFYRNAFVQMVGGGRAELESSADVAARYAGLSWRREPGRKLLLRLYLNYTREQESLTRPFRALQATVARVYPAGPPAWVRDAYRQANAALIGWYNVLTANTRLAALAAASLLLQPMLYLGFEILVLNTLLVLVLATQARRHRRLRAAVEARAAA